MTASADLVSRLQQATKGLFPEVLGVRIVEAEPERVRAELDVRDELCTVPGVMHGGALMAFADTLGGFATSLTLPPGHGTTTIESKTNFLAAASPGMRITAECSAVHRGKRTMVWQTKITREDGKLVAIVTQTQMVLEPRKPE
jgi:uncharacterized protein (TIGR00369 family)